MQLTQSWPQLLRAYEVPDHKVTIPHISVKEAFRIRSRTVQSQGHLK